MSRCQRNALLLAAVLGFLAVALGAMAAHGLKPYLDARAQNWFQLATTYQMTHSLAILAVALTWVDKNRWFAGAVAGWTVGILLFAGSLYAMALTGNTGLAWITPIGGTSFLLGWLALFVGALRFSGG